MGQLFPAGRSARRDYSHVPCPPRWGRLSIALETRRSGVQIAGAICRTPSFAAHGNSGVLNLSGKSRKQKRPAEDSWPFCLRGAPGEIRTPDLLVRSQTLYPTELRAHRKRCSGNFIVLNRGCNAGSSRGNRLKGRGLSTTRTHTGLRPTAAGRASYQHERLSASWKWRRAGSGGERGIRTQGSDFMDQQVTG